MRRALQLLLFGALAATTHAQEIEESVDGTGVESVDGTGTQAASSTDSVDGTGTQSVDGTGTQSVDGTGTQAASSPDSVDGTGTQSVDGTGTQSVDGTGTRSVSLTETDAQQYTVARGDTLGKIARQFYGDAAQWTRVYEANRDKIADPDHLEVGIVLTIPG